MIVFANSSAVVKLYADEQDHQLVRGLGGLVVSALARVEVPAAIWRKQRMGELGAADAAVLVAAFEADYHGSPGDQPRFGVVAATAAVLEAASRLVGVHGLRAYDAVQLASATAAAEAVPDCRTVAAFDVTLRVAAAAEGFALLPG
ncbi:MAG: type II toxin-antitoxin system VapC family toxin [Pseudonocardiaceae bacterium]